MILEGGDIRSKIEKAYAEFKKSNNYSVFDDLDINVMKDSSPIDCLMDVCIKLGLPARPETIEAILELGTELSSPEKNCVVMYYESLDSKSVFKHAGIYNSVNKVASRWDPNHVMIHDLEKIPSMFGNEAKFYQVTAQAMAKIHQQLQGLDFVY